MKTLSTLNVPQMNADRNKSPNFCHLKMDNDSREEILMVSQDAPALAVNIMYLTA